MLNNERVVAVIPARAGSKGVRDKNIKNLGGKPLIAWPIDVAKQSKYIDRIIVSTDGDLIAKTAKKFGAEVFPRPEHLSRDDSLAIDAIRHVISELRKEGDSAKYMVVLEPTCPLRLSSDVDDSIEKLLTHDSAATFMEASLNPHRAWKIDGNNVDTFIVGAIPWLPRQKLPPAYQLNGAAYAFKIDGLTDQNISLLFGKIAAVKMPPERSFDIDVELDFLIAERILEN